MSLRAAIYLRVSTEEQGDKNLSIPFQTAACHALAERNGWDLANDYIDIASGKTDRREAFQRLIADGRAKLFDVVVVYKYSRFARNDVDSVWYERELDRKGIKLVSATEPVDATTSTGWLNKRILQTFAEFENRQRAEFTRAGMRQRVVQGEWPWKAPLGYVNKSEVVSGRRTRSWVERDPAMGPAISAVRGSRDRSLLDARARRPRGRDGAYPQVRAPLHVREDVAHAKESVLQGGGGRSELRSRGVGSSRGSG